MPINVRAFDRDQLFLMPPSVADWLPEDHLAFFVLDIVAELETIDFYSSYRDDGRGGATYDPALMLGVLIYAYCVGERSSRRIEKRLVEDVAFRVVAANQCPDHATLPRFRRRHSGAIAGLFSQVLGLCVSSGMVDTKVVSIDGTKMEANASAWSNATRKQLAEEILAEAEETDSKEDALFGEASGGELPEAFAPGADRRTRLREALRQLDISGPPDYESTQADQALHEAARNQKIPNRKAYRAPKKDKERLVNTTDPDSRMLRAKNLYVQGYNAQAAVSCDQIIVAAEVTNGAADVTMFAPMVCATEINLAYAEADMPDCFVADTGYWSADNMVVDTQAEVLICPARVTNGVGDPDDPRVIKRKE